MTFHLAHIHDYDRLISIDIWAHRVRAAIYSLENASLEEIAYTSVRQDRRNFQGGIITDMRGVAQTIEQAIIAVSQNVEDIPKDIIISFPSHDFLFDSMTTQYLRADPTSTLTMQELDTMIKKIESQSYARAYEKAKKRSGWLHDDLRLISSTIVSVVIDGKKIANPIGFTGGRVTLTVMNIFTPASEFNVIRSIVASLGKRAISLIPMPLILPKVVEQTEYAMDRIGHIDIGYTHTTVLVSQDNEIKTFETFPIGMQMCMEMIREKCPNLSLLQIENILCNAQSVRDEPYAEIIADFFEYVLDMIWGFLEQEKIHITFTHLFLHGWVFENPTLFKVFGTSFETLCGYAVRKKRLSTLLPDNIKQSECMTYGLALTATELLLVKKDPLIRILRYVLYNYE